MKKFTISNSKMGTFLSCQKKYDLAYNHKLRKKTKHPALFKGIEIHRMLELHYLNDPEWTWKDHHKHILSYHVNNMSLDELVGLGGEFKNDSKEILTYYLKYYKEIDKDYEIIDVEWYFELPIKVKVNGKIHTIYINGLIDLVLRHKQTRQYWLLDHKTFGNKPIPQELKFINQQMILYAYALRKLRNIKVAGTIWNNIKSSPPSKPRLLKDGKLSMVKNAQITVDSFRRQAKKLNKKYNRKIIEAKYGSNISGFYFRDTTIITKSLMKKAVNNLKIVARQILSSTEYSASYSRDCQFCEFKPLCSTELFDGDVESLIKMNYDIKKDRTIYEVKWDLRGKILHEVIELDAPEEGVKITNKQLKNASIFKDKKRHLNLIRKEKKK